ncbi:hypothetical protein GALMADRAFT_259818 [Galerina marginata CBS 339.88]|uniref:Uncharacterized protein n=1 Tax=Galerina marginata (strain CBS 339.88) TaxID=685588 RepID=A0A067SH98_GALM3|nr:hypothetical protein GALMADRAFT_259818 [Galerina marginata CBS 339.88]
MKEPSNHFEAFSDRTLSIYACVMDRNILYRLQLDPLFSLRFRMSTRPGGHELGERTADFTLRD